MNKAEFLQSVQENMGILFKISASYCRNASDREDLMQEMVYQLWKSAGKFDVNYKFSTWMYRIALNVAISFYRKNAVRGVQVELHLVEGTPASDGLSLPGGLSHSTGPFSDDPLEDRIELLQRFIASLGELDKALMILYLEERSYKEIAEILGLSETNVATKLNRIKGRLRQQFLTIGGRGSAV